MDHVLDSPYIQKITSSCANSMWFKPDITKIVLDLMSAHRLNTLDIDNIGVNVLIKQHFKYYLRNVADIQGMHAT